MSEAAERAGVVVSAGYGWFRARGGVAPRPVVSGNRRGRYLSLVEREQIALDRAAGLAGAAIARRLGRSPSTITREIARNGPRYYQPKTDRYQAVLAQQRAETRARRPKAGKLAACPRLAAVVRERLEQRWSPEQISRALVADFPDDTMMRVSPETIYQSLYVQGRGGLRRELAACLRTGRAARKPRRQAQNDRRSGGALANRQKNLGMISISERPAEAEDRAVPGHWEGDLILGKDNRSAIGTLVERSTRYVVLLPLPAGPGGHGAGAVHDAMLTAIRSLPAHLWRSLTWDQGVEMAWHHKITIASGLPIYFCDPHSPWQRGSNENTNGLLRQYFPKGSDLSVHTPEHLARVAAELNGRPRKTLDWHTPAERLNQLLSNPFNPPARATTP